MAPLLGSEAFLSSSLPLFLSSSLPLTSPIAITPHDNLISLTSTSSSSSVAILKLLTLIWRLVLTQIFLTPPPARIPSGPEPLHWSHTLFVLWLVSGVINFVLYLEDTGDIGEPNVRSVVNQRPVVTLTIRPPRPPRYIDIRYLITYVCRKIYSPTFK